VTTELPADLLALLDGTSLEERVGETILVLANGDDGWPRVATVSVGELLATGPASLLLTLYTTSRTSEAVRRVGRALLLFARKGGITRVAVGVAETTGPDAARAVFLCAVERVEIDAVPYARVTHGIGFEVLDADAVIPRWRRQLEELRAIAARTGAGA
jgi:hypothetical protein